MAGLEIHLLGSFSTTLDGKPVTFAYDKLRALLAYLVLEAFQPVRREKLAGLLWPDQPSQAAQDSLRQALSKLRQAIGDREAYQPVLLIKPDSVQTNTDADIKVDSLDFSSALTRISRHAHRHSFTCPTCSHLRHSACELYKSGFLDDLSLPDSDLFEAWASEYRSRLHIQAVEAFFEQARYYIQKGDEAGAQEILLRLIELDPWNESAHALWMRWLVRNNQRVQALRHYQKVCQSLKIELGVEPAADLVSLNEEIKKESEELRASSQTNPALYKSRSPVPLTPLIGRQAELVELEAWLSDPARRLISVIGPGGVGKTRLVLAVLPEQAHAFRDGVIFVSLTDSGSRLAAKVDEKLRAARTDQVKSELVVTEHLRGKDLLLVLDGFEHAVSEANFVQAWLEDNPGLVVLLTSRQRLGLAGEWVFRLGGLEVPPPTMNAAIERYSAVKLFLQSARQSSAEFALNAENQSAVSEICRLVDGLPLALSLAAAWVVNLPCREIAQEIRQSLDILSSSGLQDDDTHSSVRAVFDQSWRILSDDERKVLPSLSIFRGGFDRQAALEVAGANLEMLTRLVEKSFLRCSQEGRYELHDLLRQYSAEKLDAYQQVDQIRARHYAFFLQMAQQNQQRFHGSDSLKAFHWLVNEQPNLQAALEWATAGDPPHDAIGAQVLRQLMHAEIHGYGVHRI